LLSGADAIPLLLDTFCFSYAMPAQPRIGRVSLLDGCRHENREAADLVDARGLLRGDASTGVAGPPIGRPPRIGRSSSPLRGVEDASAPFVAIEPLPIHRGVPRLEIN
jgi:hypothetical protein